MANQWTPMFQQYGTMFGPSVTPSLLSNVAKLESGYNPNAVNDWDINAQRGTPSVGMMQFIQPTFSGFLPQAQAARPDVFNRWTASDWRDPEAQIALAGWAMGSGKGSHWTTYKKAQGMGSTLPTSTAPSALGSVTGASPSNMSNVMDARWTAIRMGQQPMAIPSVAPGTTTGLAKMPTYTGDVPTDWRGLQQLGASRWGLVNDPGTAQTTKARDYHSLHNTGRAIDWGTARNTMEQLNAAAEWFRQQPWVEEVLWQVPKHYDHLHVGLR